MRTDGKDPVFLLALTVTAFAVLGFIGISHVGRVSGPAELRPGFGSRSTQEAPGARAAASSHLQNFKKGSEVLKARAAAFASGLGFSFGGPSRPGSAASARDMNAWRSAPSASAGAYAGDEKRDWGSMYYKGPRGLAPSGPGSWTASSGGASMTGAGSAAHSEGMVPPEEVPGGASPQGEEMSSADKEAVQRYARQQASPAAAGQAASAMYAALPRNGAAAGGPSDPGSSSLPPIPPGRSGSISGMRGGAAGAADLNGAAESMSSGSGGSYGAQMAGGAADVAARAAAVPVPSADSAKAVDGSGSSGEGAAGGGSSSSSGTPSPKEAPGKDKDASEKSKDKTVPTTQPKETPVLVASAHTPDIFQEIASEKLNGREERYLGDAPSRSKSAPGSPDPSLQVLLRPRTVHPPAAASGEKSVAQEEPPDPEDIEAVPVRRRESIKTEVHLFLRRLESGYGRMTDMQRTSCMADRQLCGEHELRGSYLTMTTAEGARLTLGMKRAETEAAPGMKSLRGAGRSGGARGRGKWSLYTIDFVDRDGRRPGENDEAAADEADEEEDEE